MASNGSERDLIVSRLREYFEGDEAKKFGLRMLGEEIDYSGSWWHVPIASGLPNMNPFDYAPVLNRIEEEFDNEGTNVLLIPDISE